MTANVVPAPPQGRDYLIELAEQGMSLSRLAAQRLERGAAKLDAIVPHEATTDQIASVRSGMGHHDDAFAAIAEELRQRFPESWIALGLPLAAPGDHALATEDTVAVCGSEVYVMQRLSADDQEVAKSLRSADPAFGYVLTVLDGVSAGTAEDCPTEAVEVGRYTVRGLGVGAYDGEGFMLVELE